MFTTSDSSLQKEEIVKIPDDKSKPLKEVDEQDTETPPHDKTNSGPGFKLSSK